VTFTQVHPTPELEDRMIRRLRQSSRGPRRRMAILFRVAAATAALLVLGVVGTVTSGLIAEGQLPFPGATAADARILAQNSLRQLGLALHNWHDLAGGTTLTSRLLADRYEKVQVLVAKQKLTPWTPIKNVEDLFEYQERPKVDVPRTAITKRE